ncbi:hypothetical protein Hanom_Chr11g00999831 [Helianthus anomalus]
MVLIRVCLAITLSNPSSKMRLRNAFRPYKSCIDVVYVHFNGFAAGTHDFHISRKRKYFLRTCKATSTPHSSMWMSRAQIDYTLSTRNNVGCWYSSDSQQRMPISSCMNKPSICV